MKAAVREIWLPFNVPLEGRVPWMYLDVRGCVRTAVGVALDESARGFGSPTQGERAAALAASRRLPWRRGMRGPYASDTDIDAAWDTVKRRTDLVRGGCRRFERVTDLRLTNGAIDRLVFERLDEWETLMRGRLTRHGDGAVITPFAAFESWPADAQLGMLSMCWSMGPAFDFPRFERAALRRDWLRCAAECRVYPEMGTVARRNERNQELFRNAFRVESTGSDPHRLLFTLP
ncbi:MULTISPECIES: hypothetical protein [Nocardia]|uniref:Uncharacterized protein n=1 Tax=Nocardia aurea TaxID=2144174 RepID=A0ABV3G4U2_9NOCA|nr:MULTISPECIES: hypothetical protein [Nocardia]